VSKPSDIGRQVVTEEAAALQACAGVLDERFDAAVATLLNAGQVIVSGLGKSGHIAQKIAATLTSTGTPAVAMHPVEALHGDLGIVTARHCLVALSRSGNTDELLRFVAHFRRLGGPVIGMTQAAGSRLAELCDHVLALPDVPEAGPLNLAPTTSCVMMLALGDALAMALLHARGFCAEDFAQYHPEGTLGRRLLLRARDLMRQGDALPRVYADESFARLLMEMTAKQLGLTLVLERDGRLRGTFTDGDLRRVFERVEDPRQLDAGAAHTHSRRPSAAPRVLVSTITPDRPAVDCLRIMRESCITALVVVDEAGQPVGVLRLIDLVGAGLG
jgi:arabinose-5-phosphate isomerase